MKIIQEFREFAIKGNVFDMAVGIVVGAAFGKVVTSLVEDLIMPPLGYVIGRVNFIDLDYTIQDQVVNAQGTVIQPEILLKYGKFLQGLFDFMIMTLALFLVIKLFNAIRRKAEDEKETSVPTPRDIELLAKIDSTLAQIDRRLQKEE